MGRSRVADVAVHVESGRLSAVAVRRSGREMSVEGWVIAAMPAGLEAGDGGAVGAWVRGELDRAGIGEAARRGGVLFAVSRGEVMLKKLTFPPGVTSHELPGMVRLQMGRHMSGAGDEGGAGVDFVPLAGGGGEGRAAAVLAAAIPPERLAWRRAVAGGAGWSIARVGLTVEGSAVVVAAMGGRAAGAGSGLASRGSVLGVVPAAGATEIVVVEGSGLAFARSIEVVRRGLVEGEAAPAGGGGDGGIAALVVEAKRTWMSYRVGSESAEVEAVVVAGTDAFASRLAAEIGASLEISSTAVDWPAGISAPEKMTPQERGALVPLVGLLSQGAGEGLNLIEPRKSAPAGEAKRRALLLGALGLVLAVGGAYTWAKRDLDGRRQDLEEVRTRQREVDVRHGEYVRARARLDHLRAYLGVKPDWTAHLNRVNQQLPEPPAAVIEDLRAGQELEVRFELPKEGGKSYFRGKWDARGVVTFGVAGRVRQRDIADNLRLRLLDEYLVEPRGADVADRFDYLLTMRGEGKKEAAPVSKAPAKGNAEKPAAGGGK